MGYDSQGYPSYFDVWIIKPRLATSADLLMLQSNPSMKDSFVRDGDTIYYYDMRNVQMEVFSNLPLFSIRTMNWAVEKAKKVVDEKYA